MLTLVQQAVQYPFKCAISGTEVGPFIDTGVAYETRSGMYPDARIYIAVSVVREIAEVAGVTEGAQINQARLTEEYNRGKFAALTEGLGDDVLRVADSLGAIARVLAGELASVGASPDTQ